MLEIHFNIKNLSKFMTVDLSSYFDKEEDRA